MSDLHFDVLIIGAGLSGIGTACHLSRECPHKRFAILERRDKIGGTSDLFRYPGIRSDSDMFSFGFAFRSRNRLKVLAGDPPFANISATRRRNLALLTECTARAAVPLAAAERR
ncbi:FAD-dependent oxidoreductase [Microbulbifer taiwanensis]|uniref:FAD-dependent oxidoreductase n=1 Tax=Microbulbifer taiwanensis TaxID=986746 RepID=A0ABW1YGU1_9GAMM|nr:FAD-dependent oxidoreductase [Microbulbifer taiwanensis]